MGPPQLCSSQDFSSTKALRFSPNPHFPKVLEEKAFFQRGCLCKGKQSLVTLHNRLRQGHLFAGLHLLTACRSRISQHRCCLLLQGACFEKCQLTEAANTCLFPLCTVTLLCRSPPPSVLWMSSPLAKQSCPLNSGEGRERSSFRSQICLPVDSTEKHIIFPCRDRAVSFIYHPLPCL